MSDIVNPDYLIDGANPTLSIDGVEYVVSSDADIRDVFTKLAGFDTGSTVGEWEVEAMDCEFDKIDSQYAFRVYVYFSGIVAEDEYGSMSHIPSRLLDIDGWEREGEMVGSGDNNTGKFGIEYRCYPDETGELHAN